MAEVTEMTTTYNPGQEEQNKEEEEGCCGCDPCSCGCICSWFAATIFIFPWPTVGLCVGAVLSNLMANSHFQSIVDRVGNFTYLEDISDGHLDLSRIGSYYTMSLIILISLDIFHLVVAMFGTRLLACLQRQCCMEKGCCADENEDGCERACSGNCWALFLNLMYVLTWIANLLTTVQFAFGMVLTVVMIMIDSLCTVLADNSDLNTTINDILNTFEELLSEEKVNIDLGEFDIDFNTECTTGAFSEDDGIISSTFAITSAAVFLVLIQSAFIGVARGNYKEARMHAKHDLAVENRFKIPADEYDTAV